MSTKRSREILEERDYYSPPAPFANCPGGIIRVTRDLPPAHFLFRINSFSIFAGLQSEENFESGVFAAGGYKWRLLVYPKGKKKRNGDGYISLYLQIVDTETLPSGWQINVNFKLFVFDQIRDKYLTIQDVGVVKRFHRIKTEWGFDQLLLLECFNDASNGYLVNDSCIFGAEVFVIEQKATWEDLSMTKQPTGNPISFKIENFSKLDEEYYLSPLQTAAGFKWKLKVYPHGYGSAKGTALSLFLGLTEESGSSPKRRLYVTYKLRLMDQISSNHKEMTIGPRWISANKDFWGFPCFVSLEDIRNPAKGFLVKDALTAEAEIIQISTSKCAS